MSIDIPLNTIVWLIAKILSAFKSLDREMMSTACLKFQSHLEAIVDADSIMFYESVYFYSIKISTKLDLNYFRFSC